jgi:hypothetical protein
MSRHLLEIAQVNSDLTNAPFTSERREPDHERGVPGLLHWNLSDVDAVGHKAIKGMIVVVCVHRDVVPLLD